ncbi:unnamed protein product [Lathyrus sativus]|nr:unnamed protein product [Lathyrus sativus]
MSTQISFYVTVLSISFATIFFFKVNSTQTTSFSFSKFVEDQPNLIFQGSAYTFHDKVTLIYTERRAVGRVLYSAPIHIWDNKTGNVADFTTSFTFVIRPIGGAPAVAEGLAFFIAPMDTKPGGNGGFLGVFNSQGYDQTIQTVAVEFDTYRNAWDPVNRHIGIDVNSIISKSTAPWNLQYGTKANVVISFKAATNALTVTLTYPNLRSFIHSDVVNLKNVVPEWVRVGFSASTGAEYSVHEVHSWSFRSVLGGTSSSEQTADE